MKPIKFIFALSMTLLGAALTSAYLPISGLEVETRQKMPDVDFSALRERAKHLASEEEALALGHAGQAFFLLNYHDEPAVLVDNSSTQLLVISFQPPSAEAPLKRWSDLLIPRE